MEQRLIQTASGRNSRKRKSNLELDDSACLESMSSSHSFLQTLSKLLGEGTFKLDIGDVN